MPTIRRPFFARLFALSTLLAVVCVASLAFAYGRVQWKSTKLQEKVAGTQSKWKIELTIFLDKAPDLPTIPVKFEFQPTVYFERFQDDSSPNVQTRRVPLTNKQAIIESADIGFLDPGAGKIENRTKFAFEITRAHGFDAGEYRVTIRDGRSGAPIGTPITLTLEGENEIIDRRAMVFAGKEDKDEKKDEKKDEGAEAPTSDDPMDTSGDQSTWQEVEEPTAALPPPEGVKSKRGCAYAGGHTHDLGLAAALAAALAVTLRRRRAR